MTDENGKASSFVGTARVFFVGHAFGCGPSLIFGYLGWSIWCAVAWGCIITTHGAITNSERLWLDIKLEYADNPSQGMRAFFATIIAVSVLDVWLNLFTYWIGSVIA